MGSTSLPTYSQPEFAYTSSPNTTFTYGQKVDATPEGKSWVEGENAGWKTIDIEKDDLSKLYALMTSAIVPRPIAFVSTISPSGVENLAPFSWFNMVTANPPIVSISVRVPDSGDGHKDTAHNIRTTQQFTVSVISEPWVDNANVCALDAPPEIDEWVVSGLTKAPSIIVKPPRVKESAFSMECELYQATDIVHPRTNVLSATLFLGLVKFIHVRKDVLNEKGTIDPAKFMPVGRMGDILYGSLQGGYRIPRPVWSAQEDRIQAFLKETAGQAIPETL